MPINVLDHHYLSFTQEVIPILVEKNIGIIGMKSMASGSIVKKNIATVAECLRFSMSMPVSTLVSGISTLEHLDQNIGVAKSFSPMSEKEIATLLEKTYNEAQGGKHEWYKAKV